MSALAVENSNKKRKTSSQTTTCSLIEVDGNFDIVGFNTFKNIEAAYESAVTTQLHYVNKYCGNLKKVLAQIGTISEWKGKYEFLTNELTSTHCTTFSFDIKYN